MAGLPPSLASSRGRSVLYSVALVVAVAGYYFAVLGPMWARSEGAIRQVRKLEQELQALGRVRQELATATEARDTARKRYEQVATQVLRPDDLPRAVGFVQQLAEARRLQVLNVRHALQGPPAGATAARLDVDLQGPYGGVLALAEALEAQFPAIEFVGLVLEASGGEAAEAPPPATGETAGGRAPSAGQVAAGADGAAGSARVRGTVSFTVPVRPPAAGSSLAAVAWSAPAVSPVRIPPEDPFRPARPLPVRAAELPKKVTAESVPAQVTGVAVGPQGALAVLRLENRSHLVRPGDRVGRLRVLRVDTAGVVAEWDGESVFIPLRRSP